MQQPQGRQGDDSSGNEAGPAESPAAINAAAPPHTSTSGVPALEWAWGDLSGLWARYSADEVRAGVQAVEKAAAVEPVVTELLRGSVPASGGRLEGLEARVKSPTAVVAALHEQLIELASAGLEVAAVVEGQRDVLRYVVVIEGPESFVGVVRAVVVSLEASGGSVLTVRDLFRSGAGHQGLHVAVRYDGAAVEVRFHSSASWQAWTRSKAAYEVARDADQPWQRRQQALDEARSHFRNVIAPAGLAELLDLSGN